MPSSCFADNALLYIVQFSSSCSNNQISPHMPDFIHFALIVFCDDFRPEMRLAFMIQTSEGAEWNTMIMLWSAEDWQEKT